MKTTELDRKPFSWSKKPENDAEFEALMSAIDNHLASQGLTPFQRPLHVGLLLWDAFRWEGPAFPPKELADLPTYDGPVLMAKCYRWYEQVFGDRLKGDWAIGYAPFRLGGALWRVRFPVVYGRCNFFVDPNLANRGKSLGTQGDRGASFNMLCSIEDLPLGLAERLSSEVLNQFGAFYVATYQTLNWRQAHLAGHELFGEAMSDYAGSVDDVLNGRYAQGRWASAQAVEKTIKGILAVTGVPYPKGGKDAHNLLSLSDRLSESHGVSIHHALLKLAQCSPAVRYGEEASSEGQALSANHAVIGIIEMLMRQPKVESLLTKI